jgi:hypothetical protein
MNSVNPKVRRILSDDSAFDTALRGLPRLKAPLDVRTRLRAIAIHERELAYLQQRAAEPTWRATLRHCQSRAHMLFENVMRPLAVPMAGGVFSAVALFHLWVLPAYPSNVHSLVHGVDVPTQLTTEAKVKRLTDIGNAQGEVVVEVTLDARGQLVDYRIISGSVGGDVKTRINFENLLAFSEFVPATSFGRPRAGKLRLCVNSSRIDVIG